MSTREQIARAMMDGPDAPVFIGNGADLEMATWKKMLSAVDRGLDALMDPTHEMLMEAGISTASIESVTCGGRIELRRESFKAMIRAVRDGK